MNELSEFDEHLSLIKESHPTATHHCTAYRLGFDELKEYQNDDGEPSGTAGRPILNQLRSSELTHTGAIIARYFGGTKLGKSGLIEAYGHTTKLCIQKALLKPVTPGVRYKVTYPYQQQSAIDQLFHTFDLVENNAEYVANVTKEIFCPEKYTDQFEKELARLQHFGIITESLGSTFTVH